MDDNIRRVTAIIAAVVVGVALIVTPGPASAHPPVSVVVAPDGRVYFSDLNDVWVLDTDGTFRVALPGVHAHELWLGADGAVFGDDVQNEGDLYRFRYWRLAPDGRVSNALDWRQGHPQEVGYSRSAPAGQNRYWALGPGGELRQIDETGHPEASVELGVEPVPPSWILPYGDAAIVVRGGSLLRVGRDATVTTLAEGLIDRTEAFAFVHDRHALMKPWTDADGRIYVPIFAGQKVVRLPAVGSTGSPEVVATSRDGWSPVGGQVLSDGTLWLLEWNGSNQPRLRRIAPDGTEQTFGPPA